MQILGCKSQLLIALGRLLRLLWIIIRVTYIAGPNICLLNYRRALIILLGLSYILQKDVSYLLHIWFVKNRVHLSLCVVDRCFYVFLCLIIVGLVALRIVFELVTAKIIFFIYGWVKLLLWFPFICLEIRGYFFCFIRSIPEVSIKQ
jgi:hypothetical protein